MAGKRSGTSTIIRLARIIAKMVHIFGAWDLLARTTPEFRAAVDALVLAVAAFEALDNAPGEIDLIPPAGPEDEEIS